ncbi:MAG TPA: glutathione S-transferase C-terminal domain-containing protein, partial [Hyphomicrobiales bacterium]|nr:glutathione S-transferase C-terminal domain-containing protein [Hyphomicrobiales bacterium]
AVSDEVRANVARIEKIWADCRKRQGRGGPFLFGRFSAADAMFAPVVSRFHVYDVPVSADSRAYMQAVMAEPAWTELLVGARAEPANAKYDQIG